MQDLTRSVDVFDEFVESCPGDGGFFLFSAVVVGSLFDGRGFGLTPHSPSRVVAAPSVIGLAHRSSIGDRGVFRV